MEGNNQLVDASKLNLIKSIYAKIELFKFVPLKIKLFVAKNNQYIKALLGIKLEEYKKFNEIIFQIEILHNDLNFLNYNKDKYDYHIYYGDNDFEINPERYINHSGQLVLDSDNLEARKVDNQIEERIKNKESNIENQRKEFIENIDNSNNPNDISTKNHLVGDSDSILTIKIQQKIESLLGLFKDCKGLKKIKFLKFNNLSIRDISCMFWKCIYLEEVDFSFIQNNSFNDMSFLFYKCSSLVNVNLVN